VIGGNTNHRIKQQKPRGNSFGLFVLRGYDTLTIGIHCTSKEKIAPRRRNVGAPRRNNAPWRRIIAPLRRNIGLRRRNNRPQRSNITPMRRYFVPTKRNIVPRRRKIEPWR
jgi:hypothetical protein